VRRNRKSDSMPARASPSDSAVPHNFSILLTCGFTFGHYAGTCFHVVYTPHPVLKELKTLFISLLFLLLKVLWLKEHWRSKKKRT